MRAIWILALCCLAVLMAHAKKVRVAVVFMKGSLCSNGLDF